MWPITTETLVVIEGIGIAGLLAGMFKLGSKLQFLTDGLANLREDHVKSDKMNRDDHIRLGEIVDKLDTRLGDAVDRLSEKLDHRTELHDNRRVEVDKALGEIRETLGVLKGKAGVNGG